jgi:hypothetical protein
VASVEDCRPTSAANVADRRPKALQEARRTTPQTTTAAWVRLIDYGVYVPQAGHLFRGPEPPRLAQGGHLWADRRGRMWQAVRASCTVCIRVVAGDFSSLGGINGVKAAPGRGPAGVLPRRVQEPSER